MLLLLICLLAGCLTIFAPCVLPILPVIVGSSLSSDIKSKLRPYIISVSLGLSVIIFTLLLKFSTLLINISSNDLNYFSGGIIIAFGIVTLWPELWEKLVIKLNLEARSLRLLSSSEHKKSKYIGPVLIGLALGPVFSSCSPTYAFILATVLPHSFLSGLVYLIAFSVGVVITLLLIAFGGKKLIQNHTWAINTHGIFRRTLGILFILIGLVIINGRIIPIETWVANHTPFDETKIERFLLSKQQKSNIYKSIVNSVGGHGNVLNVQPTPAPNFAGLTNWINSPPLTIPSLKGKVVLVDFWTYSCINCIRSLPYIEKWYQAYQDNGFVVVGVNTPEFAFEHIPANVAAAVSKDGIKYPVALDNNYATWNAYNNNSWPADYLIDRQGNIRYVSLGEGSYDITNKAIEQLLNINTPLVTPVSVVPITNQQTAETYFGSERQQTYVGNPPFAGGSGSFTAATALSSGEWTLSGAWQVNTQSITSLGNDSTLTFNLSAKNVYMVASSSSPQTVQVTLPGNTPDQFGVDAPGGLATVNESRLYHILGFSKFSTATVSLKVPSGTSIYTFTFGS